MTKNRPSVPAELERRVKIEAGHRCAIPTCKYNRVEIAHIVPWSEVFEHRFENLIALCPNCHNLYDKDKKIDRKSILIYKQNLGLLNHRYGEYERRVLQYFLESRKEYVFISGGSELLIHFLVKDDLLFKTTINSGISSEIKALNSGPIYSWTMYKLTDSGRLFIKNWEGGAPLD